MKPPLRTVNWSPFVVPPSGGPRRANWQRGGRRSPVLPKARNSWLRFACELWKSSPSWCCWGSWGHGTERAAPAPESTTALPASADVTAFLSLESGCLISSARFLRQGVSYIDWFAPLGGQRNREAPRNGEVSYPQEGSVLRGHWEPHSGQLLPVDNSPHSVVSRRSQNSLQGQHTGCTYGTRTSKPSREAWERQHVDMLTAMQTPNPNKESSRTIRKGAGSTVGFRLNPAELAQLSAMAERDGVSVHEMARRLVLAALRTGVGAGNSIDPGVVELVRALRTDLAVVLEAVLVMSGALPPEDAKRLVEEKLG